MDELVTRAIVPHFTQNYLDLPQSAKKLRGLNKLEALCRGFSTGHRCSACLRWLYPLPPPYQRHATAEALSVIYLLLAIWPYVEIGWLAAMKLN